MAVTRLKRTIARLLAVGLGLGPSGSWAVAAAGPQQAAAPSQDAPTFGIEASAVLVDVVVRDKKGRLVRDLTPSDFDVYEDGVKQTLASFQVFDNEVKGPERVETAPTATSPGSASAAGSPGVAPAPATPSPATSAGVPSVIAFVFDRMSANARRTALKASLTYTDRGHVPGDLVGVFSIDLALKSLQPFTTDLPAVRLALTRAGSQGNTAFASEREEGRDRSNAVMRADDALGSLASTGGSGAGSSGAQTQAALIASQQAFDQMQVNMLHTFDALERDQQGYASTNGLLAVVNGLKAIPGRKTVVFFSEGLAIPANVQAQFRSVITSANRSNVSIYAIDAGGLRTESGNKEARDEIVQAARRRITQESTGREEREGAMTRTLERTEDLLRLNPESGLGQLAEETGGFLVHDTNDASSGFERIQQDMRFYYLLSYAPTNEAYDGSFRSISVKLRRSGLTLQTRKGYLAVRPAYAVPIRTYEAPALAQFELSPRPAAFPLGTAALSFPESERPGLAPVLVEIPGSAVTWAPQKPTGFHAAFVVVVRIRDEHGREADRLSQEYQLSAPADKLEAARRGNILFYREANVPPGHYTAEAVAYDALAKTASVRTVTLEVPKADPEKLRLSSLILVRRVEKLPSAEQGGKNPLHYGEAMLYPSMGEPFRKSIAPDLAFYFNVYGGKSSTGGRKATIELRQGTRTLATLPTDLPAPDATGRIQYAGALPLKGLSPGSFTLRVSVTDGPTVGMRETPFIVGE